VRADSDRPSADDPVPFEVPTSMIDVVFLLLIFFMCVSTFVRPEHRLDVGLTGGPGPPPPPPPPPSVVVRIRMDGERALITAQDYACRDLNDLAARLGRLSRAVPDVQVVVDGRSNVPFQYVIGAMDACGRARITNVSLMEPVAGAGGSDYWYD